MADNAQSVTPNQTAKAKVKLGLGSLVFRPNAVLNGGAYRTLIVVEIAVMVALWLIAPSYIPSPLKVWTAFTHLLDLGLVGELWVSLTLNLQALALSTIISLVLAYASAIPVMKPLAVAVSKLRFLSLVGMSFVATLIVGGGHDLKLALLTFGMTVFFVTSMVDVVLQVPQDMLYYVRTMRASEWRVLIEARIKGTMGQAFDIARQNAAMGWLMLTMVEGLVRSEGGIGKMLLEQEKHFSLPSIFAVQMVFLLVGVGQDQIIVWLKSVFAPWASLAYSKDKS